MVGFLIIYPSQPFVLPCTPHTHTHTHTESIKVSNSLHVAKCNPQFSVSVVSDLSAASYTVASSPFLTHFFTWFVECLTLLVGLPLRLLLFEAFSKDYPPLENL